MESGENKKRIERRRGKGGQKERERKRQRHGVGDKEWEKIKNYMQEKKGRAGNDDRKFANGVF